MSLRDALIGLVGVLLAGAIGAGSSIWTVLATIDSQHQEARDSYLRGQRQENYAQFLTNIQKYRSSIDLHLAHDFEKQSTIGDDAQLKVDRQKVSDTLETLQIIGTATTFDRATKLLRAADTYEVWVFGSIDHARQTGDGLTYQIKLARDELILAMKADLQN